MSVGRAYRYPFESPVIRVLEGDGVIPRSVLSDDLLTLPGSDGWTPSRTIITTLEVFFFFFQICLTFLCANMIYFAILLQDRWQWKVDSLAKKFPNFLLGLCAERFRVTSL